MAEPRHLAQEGRAGGASTDETKELGLRRGTYLVPGAVEVQKREGAGEGQQRASQSSALPHLALSDFSPDLSGTRQGLAARVPRGP